MKSIKWMVIIIAILAVQTAKPMDDQTAAARQNTTVTTELFPFVMSNVSRYLPLTSIPAIRLTCKGCQKVWDEEKVLEFFPHNLEKMCHQVSPEKRDFLSVGLRILNEKLKKHSTPISLCLNKHLFTSGYYHHFEELPDELYQLKQIKRLALIGHELSPDCIAKILSSLPNLEALNVGDNHLQTLPIASVTHTRLKSLFLDHNLALRLENIIEFCYMLPNLEELSLTGGYLKQLPAARYLLPSIKILHVNRTFLSQESIEQICQWFPNLEELDLSDNNLDRLPLGIGRLKKLKKLQLSRNPLSSTDIKQLCSLQPQLETLDLENCNISNLPTEFMLLQNLHTLHLSVNKELTAEDLIKISQLSALETLYLYNCKLRTLPETMRNLKRLKALWLANNRLSEQSLINISMIQSLEFLAISQNQLSDLPAQISNLINLKEFMAYGNYWDPHVLVILSHLPMIERINIASTYILPDVPYEITRLKGHLKILGIILHKDVRDKVRQWLPNTIVS